MNFLKHNFLSTTAICYGAVLSLIRKKDVTKDFFSGMMKKIILLIA
jgi:hypothetical protein